MVCELCLQRSTLATDEKRALVLIGCAVWRGFWRVSARTLTYRTTRRHSTSPHSTNASPQVCCIVHCVYAAFSQSCLPHRAPAVCALSRLCFTPLTCAHTTGHRPRDRPPCSQAQGQAACTRQEPCKGVAGAVQAGNFYNFSSKQVQTPRAAASPARTPASMAAPKTKTPKSKAVPEEVWIRQNSCGFFV